MRSRPCERTCDVCKESKHHSRFHLKTGKGTIARFDPVCLDCRQRERNERKNLDRPLAIIKQRALTAAHKAGVSIEFLWTQMNYGSLVEAYRVLMSPVAKCQNCGHLFEGQGDIQIEHIAPPRDRQDWARIHARNLRLLCGACNARKGKKSFEDWLDDQEVCRLSNLDNPKAAQPDSDQITLFGDLTPFLADKIA